MIAALIAVIDQSSRKTCGQAKILLEKKRFDQTLALLDTMRHLQDVSAGCHYLCAHAFFGAGQYGEAREQCLYAPAKNDAGHRIYYLMGHAEAGTVSENMKRAGFSCTCIRDVLLCRQ